MKTLIYLFSIIFLTGCSYMNGSGKYIGIWEGTNTTTYNDYFNISHKITLDIKKNSADNFLIKISFDDKEQASDVYFYKDGCLVKNTETICFNEEDKTLILLLSGKPIILKKVDGFDKVDKTGSKKQDSYNCPNYKKDKDYKNGVYIGAGILLTGEKIIPACEYAQKCNASFGRYGKELETVCNDCFKKGYYDGLSGVDPFSLAETKGKINVETETIKKLSYTEIKEIFNNTYLSEIITSSDYFTDYDLENTTAISFVKQSHPDNKIQCKVSGDNEIKNVVNLTFEILNKETDQIEASMKFTYDRSTEKFEFIGEFKEK